MISMARTFGAPDSVPAGNVAASAPSAVAPGRSCPTTVEQMCMMWLNRLTAMSSTTSTLVASGVDIIKSLEITGTTSGNWVVEEALADVRARVHEGVPIAQPLLENPVFPPMVSQMVKIGEETGELEKMLSKIADFYEDEVDASIQTLTSIVEPIMMIGVAGSAGSAKACALCT